MNAPDLLAILNATALVTMMLSMGLRVGGEELLASAGPAAGPTSRVRRPWPRPRSRAHIVVGLVIVARDLAGTPAVTAVVAYGLVSIVGALGLRRAARQARRRRNGEGPRRFVALSRPDTLPSIEPRKAMPMARPRYPSLYQINTRVWLTELSRKLGRAADAGRHPRRRTRPPGGDGLRLGLVPERLADRRGRAAGLPEQRRLAEGIRGDVARPVRRGHRAAPGSRSPAIRSHRPSEATRLSPGSATVFATAA